MCTQRCEVIDMRAVFAKVSRRDAMFVDKSQQRVVEVMLLALH